MIMLKITETTAIIISLKNVEKSNSFSANHATAGEVSQSRALER